MLYQVASASPGSSVVVWASICSLISKQKLWLEHFANAVLVIQNYAELMAMHILSDTSNWLIVRDTSNRFLHVSSHCSQKSLRCRPLAWIKSQATLYDVDQWIAVSGVLVE